MPNLQQNIESEIGRKTISKIEIPEYITNNLKHTFWYWQKEALQHFIAFDSPVYEFEKPLNEPTHLMFNMATGTGKTMLIAALILYFYKKGFRHFVFFVNQNNIVSKTEDNLIIKSHTKYEYRQNIIIDDKLINIRKVDSFDDSDDIQIIFTSIQKLHNAIYQVKENFDSLEDFQKRDLILIGDEAHHLNASTIRNGQMELDIPSELKDNSSEADIEKSWENTVVNKLLRKCNSKQTSINKNVLLEFTATIPKNADVTEKYRLKTIYKFELADFLNAGYTKEINLVSTSLNKKEKILLAILFNWYRAKIALENNLPNFKPVILFRSKFIEESKNDYREFLSIISDLKTSDFDFLINVEDSIKQDKANPNSLYEQGKSRIKQMLSFISQRNVSYSEIVDFLINEFAEKNCIITNSEDNTATTKEKTTEDQERLLNNLEDPHNHIRAIFTVKRLTEGWDVLNLYDIVRLYDGRDERPGRDQRITGQATVQEIQLIGRGVRYYPFTYPDTERNKRKFDNELENPMRVLEEFYFHSDDDVKYLDELKRALKNRGFIQDNRVIKKFILKPEFTESVFFKELKIWKNDRIDNPGKRKFTLTEIQNLLIYKYYFNDVFVVEQQVDLNDDHEDDLLLETEKQERRTIVVKIKDFEKHIIAKAINIKSSSDSSILRFENLKEELVINSIDDLINEKFIGDLRINIITSKNIESLEEISNEVKLDMLLGFFDNFSKKLNEISNPFLGTPDFLPFSFKELFGGEKEKSVIIDQESKRLEDELLHRDWYILNGFNGTSEERELLEYLMDKIKNLQDKYDEVYLLRNEEVYKIYDFEQGRGFEPDFLLFLKGKLTNQYFQLFIEPKGTQFQDRTGGFGDSREGWKEDFLQQITAKYGVGSILKAESKRYLLIGLPLFNHIEEVVFDETFSNLILK